VPSLADLTSEEPEDWDPSDPPEQPRQRIPLNDLGQVHTFGELRSYTPPPSERVGDLLQRGLMALGADTYSARHLGQGLRDLAQFSPLGIPLGVADFDHYARQGEIGNAILAALPVMIPPTRMAGKGIRAVHGSPPPMDKTTAYGPRESTPGLGIGHFPDLPNAPMRERAEYFDSPHSRWEGADGRDRIYVPLGMDPLPTQRATGMYQSPGGPVEMNLSAVARPQVRLTDEAGVRAVDSRSRALLNAAEGLSAYVGAQNAGAWLVPIRGNRLDQSRSLFVPNKGSMNPDEMLALKEAGSRYGLGDVVDLGSGAVMTNFRVGPPGAKALAEALEQGGLNRAIGEIMPGAKPQRVQLDSGYIGYENAWRDPPGSGAVTRELQKHLQNPEIIDAIAKLDGDPGFRQTVLNHIERDKARAEKTGQPVREDLQLAREIIVKDGVSGLLRALQQGVALPAAAALLTPLMFGPPAQDRDQ
jgi:hypothetical protein